MKKERAEIANILKGEPVNVDMVATLIQKMRGVICMRGA